MDPRFPEPKLREEFRRELRARLMMQAQTVLVPRRRRDTAWTFLRPAFGVGLAAAILMAGAGTAAAGSVPGDPAFGLKRAAEELQVTLTFDGKILAGALRFHGRATLVDERRQIVAARTGRTDGRS